MKNFKHGFTLAEVLITLAIIGVVAAMTIPTLIDKINNKVNSNQKTVIEKRFVQGLNLYNTQENGLSGKQHNSTYDFLQGLSKHFKMSSICDTNNIAKCFPYENINYEEDGVAKSIPVSNIKAAGNMGLNNNDYYSPAAFITASGVPFLVVLKKDCMEDPDEPLKTYSSCLDGIYDINGSRTPNTMSRDVQSIRNASISNCVYKIGSGSNAICVRSAFFTPSDSEAQFAYSKCGSIVSTGKFTDENGKEVLVTGVGPCPYNSWFPNKDYWLAAKINCARLGLDLPNEATLIKFARAVYGENLSGSRSWAEGSYKTSEILDAVAKYGLTNTGDESTPKFVIWRNDGGQYNSYSAFWRVFSYDGFGLEYYGNKNNSTVQAFCVAN